ncbi:MAG: helicase-associated domain-containing protein [Anaerolineales bacterium]|nr:helicase-associated domain-containing protein [Anaerolineales bacterium]
MVTLQTLTEQTIRELLSTAVWRRAKSYVGRVQNPRQVGDHMLRADVHGTQQYQVEVEVRENQIYARCTCPYGPGAYCKHAGALLLKWIWSRRSFAVETRDPVASTVLETTPAALPSAKPPQAEPFWYDAQTAAANREINLLELQDMLGDYRLQDLRQIARTRGWSLSGTRKDDIIATLAAHMTAPSEIIRGQLALDAPQRQVLRALALCPVFLAREEVITALLQHLQVTSLPRPLHAIMQELAQHGLVVDGTRVQDRWLPGGYISQLIMQHLAPLHPEVVPDARDRLPEAEAGRLRLADAQPLLQAIGQLLPLLGQTAVPLRTPMPRPRMEQFVPQLADWDYVPEELLTFRVDARLNQNLTVPPPAPPLPDDAIARLTPLVGSVERLTFVYYLLRQAGILWSGSPITVDAAARDAFMQRTPEQQRALLTRTYFSLIGWNELWQVLQRAPDLRLRRRVSYGMGPEHLALELHACRHVVLHVLSCLPDNQWIAVADLLPLLAALWPQLDGSLAYGGRGPGSWFVERDGRPLQVGNKRDWQAAQGAFVGYLLAGPLHWLGLVDLAVAEKGLVALRLHGLADLYWDRVETPPFADAAVPPAEVAAPETAVSISGTTIAVQPAAISAQAHALLDRIARLGQTTLHAFTYELDVQAVYESFVAGDTLAALQSAWDEYLRVPMPEEIAAQLAAWWAGYGRVTLYDDMTILEFSDDYALAEVKAVTTLAEKLIVEVSPRLVLIPDTAVDGLRAELEKAGYTPRLV